VEREEGAGPQPRALIVTVYGLYARARGGWLAVSALIRLLAEVGVDAPAVRSAISRLKRRGMLAPERRGGVAGYVLSRPAEEMLAEGDERIFAPPVASLADGWVLAVFSVPESERHKRHTLRSRLAWLGFGAVAPGVWIAPAHRYDTTRATLSRLDLSSYVDLFHGSYLAFGAIEEHVHAWWDLDGLGKLYDEFIAAWSGPLPRDPAGAFATLVRVVTDWRRLPYLDPGLPAALLPPDWHGTRAAELFAAVRAELAGPADRHVAGTLAE